MAAPVIETGFLTVGVDASPPPPMQLGDPASDTFEGLEVDLLRAVAARLGLVVRFRSALWSTILAELEAGRLDLICTAATITPEREREFLFGRPYLEVALVVVVRAGSPYTSLEDLRTRALAVRTGTLAEDYLRETLVPGSILLTEFNDEAYEAVRSGRVEGLVDDGPIADWFVAGDPGLRILGTAPGTRSAYAMVFAKRGHELAAAVDHVLDGLATDGTLDRIRDRWLPRGSPR
jgi:ABC-type amino acid transport substrate-binding protein